MNIAIKGHQTRGNEVIQILESLRGINTLSLLGSNINCYYYIKDNNIRIIINTSNIHNYKLYTLEEFEKEFPFKIGDIVLFKGTNNPYEVIALEWYMNKLCYKLDNGLHYALDTLTTYEKMKEERNITLTFEKAKEWYKKGGELKEIALQAFTEKELTKVELPKTWEEFCNNYPTKKGEYYIDICSDIVMTGESVEGRDIKMDKNVCPSEKSAKAHLALIQLEQLRDCYRGLFITVIGMPVWCITRYRGELIVSKRIWCTNETFLSFQSHKVAEEYLKNFTPLIEQAGDLI